MQDIDLTFRTHISDGFGPRLVKARIYLVQEATVGIESKLNHQVLARDVCGIPGVISCTVIDNHGVVLGQASGEIPHRADIMERIGSIGAVIWGGAGVVESEAGTLTSIAVSYRTFRILGVPFASDKFCVLATASVIEDQSKLIGSISTTVATMKRHLEMANLNITLAAQTRAGVDPVRRQ